MKKRVLLAALCLAVTGCSKNDGAEGTPATGEGAAAAAPSGGVAISKLGLTIAGPEGTKVSELLGSQQVEGPGLTLHIAKASPDDEKEMAAAVSDLKETYDEVTNVKQEKLADGWLFTAESKGGMGTGYWVKGWRTIGGQDYTCEVTAPTAERQANAAAACKSLAAAR